jgi:hypothetical protein
MRLVKDMATLEDRDSPEAAARHPGWRRPIFLAPIPIAALAALLLLVRPGKPPDDYVGVKWGAGEVGLVLFTAGPTGVATVGDGAAVFARAQLRFRIRAAPGCNLWIASIDGAGVVSRLFPATGDGSVQVAAGEQDLPGSAILDGRLGPERLYAVCTPHALPWSELEAGLRRTSVRPGTVRAPAPPALPVGATWTSILLEKRP